jgi:hypothetical protein
MLSVNRLALPMLVVFFMLGRTRGGMTTAVLLGLRTGRLLLMHDLSWLFHGLARLRHWAFRRPRCGSLTLGLANALLRRLGEALRLCCVRRYSMLLSNAVDVLLGCKTGAA